MPRTLGKKLEEVVEIEGIKYMYTPYEIARQGYISIYEMKWLYGLTRNGFYGIYTKMPIKPKKIRVGRKVYYEKKVIDEYFFENK